MYKLRPRAHIWYMTCSKTSHARGIRCDPDGGSLKVACSSASETHSCLSDHSTLVSVTPFFRCNHLPVQQAAACTMSWGTFQIPLVCTFCTDMTDQERQTVVQGKRRDTVDTGGIDSEEVKGQTKEGWLLSSSILVAE